jgi:hypothetical protein
VDSLDDKHGLDLLLNQYSNSQSLKEYIQCILSEFDEVKKALQDIVKYRYLADSFGVQVDDIAYLVGASRTIYGAKALGYFGYYEDPEAYGTGDDNQPGIGGRLKSDYDRDSGDFVRTDVQLKNAIRARIIKATSGCTLNDMYNFCDLIVGRSLPMVITEGKLSVDFHVKEELPVGDKVILSFAIADIKPAGITATFRDNSGNIELVYYSKDYPTSVI